MYRGDDYPDMSEYLVHFTRAGDGEAGHPGGPKSSAYDNLMSLLYQGHVKPGTKRFGTAKNLAWLGDMRRAACFSEIPLPYVGRIAKRRSQYGVGFHQKFVAANRGARVWYLDTGSAHEAEWLKLQAEKAQQRNPNDGFWGLAGCVDRAGVSDTWRYEFEWEREWRVPGPLGLRFEPSDVAFIFVPEHQRLAAQGFFDSFFASLGGPGYECPYIDPYWPPKKISEALAVLMP